MDDRPHTDAAHRSTNTWDGNLSSSGRGYGYVTSKYWEICDSGCVFLFQTRLI